MADTAEMMDDQTMSPVMIPATAARPEPETTTPGNAGDPAKRQQILEGARRVFRACGFDGASMGDIARAAGVSKGTLYVYFASKEGLFTALVVEEKRAQAEALFQLDSDNPDVRQVLYEVGLKFLEHLSNPDKLSNIRMVMGATEKFPHIGQAFFTAGPGQGLDRMKVYFDHQVAAGRLNIANTALAAQHFCDLCQSGILRRLLFRVGEPPGESERNHLVQQGLDVFFAAYGPKTGD